MKILIPIKQIASLDEDFEIRDDGRDIDPDFLVRDLNEWDNYSLEEAVRMKEAGGEEVEVIVVTVGDDDAEEELRKCLAKGADRAIRIWDERLADADQIGIARVLAALAKREAPDLIFAGVQSADQATGATGIALAGLLNLPHAAVVATLQHRSAERKATVWRELEGGSQAVAEVDTPAVLTLQLGINTPRYASLRGIKQAAARPIEVIEAGDLGLADEDIGAGGSLSRVRRMYVPEKGRAELITGTPAEQAAQLAKIIKEFRG